MNDEVSKRRVLGLMLACSVPAIVVANGAHAEDKPAAAYRAAVTSSLDSHMKAVEKIVGGDVPYWHHLLDHAVAIVGISRGLLELFPEKSGATAAGGNAAAPKEETRSAFVTAAAQFNADAAKLVQAAMTGQREGIASQFAALNRAYQALQKQLAS